MSLGLKSIALAWTGLVASASPAEDLVSVYFGCGCFWHVQHEFIQAEQRILSRDGPNLTALSGYAGGTRLNSLGTACYDDYDSNGHTEVVEVRIPRSSIPAFAAVFWGLFVGKNRVDVMDQGPGYRAALGLPGGMSSSLLQEVDASQEGHVSQRFQLLEGSGNDRDTLGEALVWVYDSERFPFYQAELFHQFHDDFMPGGDYPASYNIEARNQVLSVCRMRSTGCPDDQSVTCGEQTYSQNLGRHGGGSGGSGLGMLDGGGSSSSRSSRFSPAGALLGVSLRMVSAA